MLLEVFICVVSHQLDDCSANDSSFNSATLGALKSVIKASHYINVSVINVQHKAENETVTPVSPIIKLLQRKCIVCVILVPAQAF